mmetsp:Transcript_38536/g.123887  ORF Transcript_38536/g.123887 Transcript_38536/m.123887 type:complete len:200 (-) Transcript_38536:1504-2103(-)
MCTAVHLHAFKPKLWEQESVLDLQARDPKTAKIIHCTIWNCSRIEEQCQSTKRLECWTCRRAKRMTGGSEDLMSATLRVLDMSQGKSNDWRQRRSHECPQPALEQLLFLLFQAAVLQPLLDRPGCGRPHLRRSISAAAAGLGAADADRIAGKDFAHCAVAVVLAIFPTLLLHRLQGHEHWECVVPKGSHTQALHPEGRR